VVLEQVGVADVRCEHVGAAESADLLQLEHAGASPGAGGYEARAQRVPGEARRVVAGRGDAGLHHAGHSTVAHGIGGGETLLHPVEDAVPGVDVLDEPGMLFSNQVIPIMR